MPQTANAIIDAAAAELYRTDLQATGPAGANVAVSQRAVNDTLRDLLARHTWSWRLGTTPETIATVAGTTDYTLVTAVQDIEAIILDDGTSATRELNERTANYFLDRWANVAYLGTSRPRDYLFLGLQSFRIAPAPDQVYNLRVWSYPEFLDITTFTANLNVVDRVLEIIKVGVLARLSRFTREWDQASGYLQLYEKLLPEAIKQDKEHPDMVLRMLPFRAQPETSGQTWANPLIQSAL